MNGGEIASCERKFDEREGGRTLTNRKERTGWKEERWKILRSSPRLRRDCRGYGKNNAMVAEYSPLRPTTNKSAPVSGFYNWPEVVQLRKRDAGRPPRESSFAPCPSLSFILFSFVKGFLHPLSFSMCFAWMFHYGRRRRNDSLGYWFCWWNRESKWSDDTDIWKIVRIELSEDRHIFFFFSFLLIKIMILFFKKGGKMYIYLLCKIRRFIPELVLIRTDNKISNIFKFHEQTISRNRILKIFGPRSSFPNK